MIFDINGMDPVQLYQYMNDFSKITDGSKLGESVETDHF